MRDSTESEDSRHPEEGASCLALRDEGGSACESEWQTFEARAVDCHYASELATHSCNWTCIKRRRPCVDVKASRAEQSAKVGDVLDLIPVILDAHGGIGRTKELRAKCWTEYSGGKSSNVKTRSDGKKEALSITLSAMLRLSM